MLKKSAFTLIFLDYGHSYGRSAKKEKNGRTIQVSFYDEYLCILTEKKMHRIIKLYTTIYVFLLFYLRISLED